MGKVVLLVAIVFAVATVASAFPGGFGTPAAPQPLQLHPERAHWDIQTHSRDPFTWGDNSLESIMAQHGPDCSAPPATHENHSYAGAVFACNNHLMTSMNASGYGEIMLTPSQLLNCSAGCSVQWDMSTEKMSGRDWPDVWLTPWSDNLALPIEPGLPDLQGIPRRGLQLSAATGHNSWLMYTIANFQQTGLDTVWWEGMHSGITAGTNQAATRQTFKLTITPGRIRLERLASATATNFVWYDGPCNCLLAPDYVVQFGHHSYTPTKDGAGVPATWHWFNPSSPLLSPASPFTLIHTTPRMVSGNSVVTFNAPAPANAMLRFSAICKVSTDASGVMAVAPKQTFLRNDTVASYFIPVQQGRTNVSVSFAADDWYGGPCHAKDFHVWAKSGGAPSTPTPSATSTSVPTSTATTTPVATSTSIAATPTPNPSATPTSTVTNPTVIPNPSATPQPVTRQCTLRWGNNTIENYGPLTEAACALRGN